MESKGSNKLGGAFFSFVFGPFLTQHGFHKEKKIELCKIYVVLVKANIVENIWNIKNSC